MGRARQDGLLFFPLEVNWLARTEIRVLRGKLGDKGTLLCLMLLCRIYEQGYFLPLTDDLLYDLALNLNTQEKMVRDTIQYMAEHLLLEERLLREERVLTSREIQMQYQECVKGRAARRNTSIAVERRLWLLKREETCKFIQLVPVLPTELCTEQPTEPSTTQDAAERVSRRSTAGSTTAGKKEDFSGRKDHKSGRNSDKSVRISDKSGRNATKEKKRKKKQSIRKEEERKKGGRWRVMSSSEAIVQLYRERCAALPQIKTVTPRLRRQLQSGIRRGYTLSDYRGLFDEVSQSRFLSGTSESSGFRATLSWLTEPSHMEEVLSGRYRDWQTPEPVSTQESSFDVNEMFADALRRSYGDSYQELKLND